ncbi:hypothetical protein BABINDRAFT_39663 [Babjeviella inositovora NRRL Y-12698]|uniref:Uncharacterized protein n=1 Tax=Babjeviella inositovora NRRL Y-12698 TaxID=984486 RepID=A0A1E3QLT0_9ASCO|nr:uncharacterized protein BABINDRAFT_39663 [Babjeviella inositovora NRRL Y-12698]ODQ78610.1 hypothetical protein BABINDRAFT_39663 [Babjeviella inositovora NRRL Y-12698]
MVKNLTWEAIQSMPLSVLSPAVLTTNGSNLIFTSGAIGADPATDKIPEDITSQAELAFQNLLKVLEVSGSSASKILKVLLFVGHPSYGPAVNKVYTKYFPGAPARSCIVVAFPNPSIKVEIECIAEYEPKSIKAKF